MNQSNRALPRDSLKAHPRTGPGEERVTGEVTWDPGAQSRSKPLSEPRCAHNGTLSHYDLTSLTAFPGAYLD